MVEKEVKKKEQVKNKEVFTLHIFNKLKEGLNPSQISKQLNISKQKVNYYISSFKKQGFIKKKGYGTWEILKEFTEKDIKKRSKKDSSIGMRVEKPITNLHALQINFPILEGKIEDSTWKVKNKLKNWLPKYKGLTELGGLTLRNNNNKSISVFLKARNIESVEEVDNLAFKVKSFVYAFLKSKYGVLLDIFNCQVKNLNLATQDKASEPMIRKGEKFELDLDKKAEKVFPKDQIDAKAWIDGSPFKFSAETNDKEWKRAYLQMPFIMKDIGMGIFHQMKMLEGLPKNMELMGKQIESHLKLIQEYRKENRAWRKSKVKEIRKELKEGKQTDLLDFY